MGREARARRHRDDARSGRRAAWQDLYGGGHRHRPSISRTRDDPAGDAPRRHGAQAAGHRAEALGHTRRDGMGRPQAGGAHRPSAARYRLQRPGHRAVARGGNDMTERIFIHDVVARDGFQIEPDWIPTERKIEIIDRLSRTGVAKIEATSFVSPKAVPQLRDAAEVMAGIRRNPDVTYVALVPNARGAERALAARVDEVVLVVSASETHNRANVRRSVGEAFAGFTEVLAALRGSDVGMVGAIATAFGCPFQGSVPESQVLDCIGRYVDLGVRGVTFGDTTGMANPRQVQQLVGRARERFSDDELTVHFHNTRGIGLANVVAGPAG